MSKEETQEYTKLNKTINYIFYFVHWDRLDKFGSIWTLIF